MDVVKSLAVVPLTCPVELIAADADAESVKVATKVVTLVPLGTVIATVRAVASIVDAPV